MQCGGGGPKKKRIFEDESADISPLYDAIRSIREQTLHTFRLDQRYHSDDAVYKAQQGQIVQA